MSHQDPVASMLTSLRNGAVACLPFVDLPLSQFTHEILKVFESRGFVEHILVDSQKKKMRVFLKYKGREPLLQGLKRISKLSCRQYVKQDEIPTVLGGLGSVVLSTSHGVMDGEAAREKGIGGELLCCIW